MFRFHFGGLHVTCGFPSQSNHQKGGTDRSGVTSLRPMAKWPMVDTPETMGATMINRRFLFLPFCRAGDMCGFFCGLPHYPVFFFQRLHPLLNPGSGGLGVYQAGVCRHFSDNHLQSFPYFPTTSCCFFLRNLGFGPKPSIGFRISHKPIMRL